MLNVKWLDAKLNKPQAKEITKAHQNGLYARVRKTGSISFVFKYFWLGKRDTLTIGRYRKITLNQAAEIAKNYQAMIVEDKNPRTERLTTRLKDKNSYTVEQLAREWRDHHFADHPKRDIKFAHPHTTMQALKNHIFPELGKFPWDKVDRMAWVKLFQKIKKTAPSMASSLVTITKQIANYGIESGIVENHPLMEYSPSKSLGITRKRRSRILTEQELSRIFEQLEVSRIQESNKILFKLLLIYGCRTIELRLCEPKHLNIKKGVWTVPKEIAKPKNLKDIENTQEIIRPLFNETIKLFERAIQLSKGSKYLFPITNGKRKGEAMASPAMLDIPIRIRARINDLYPDEHMPTWSKHDFRRTMRSTIGSFTERNVAEKMLGHSLGMVEGTYDVNSYLEKQLLSYQEWYQILDSIWSKPDLGE